MDDEIVVQTKESNGRPMSTLRPATIVQLSILSKAAILLMLGWFFHFYGGHHHLALFGPQADFKILDVYIDTWTKYLIVIAMIVISQTLSVVVKEIGAPIIKFNVFNPLVTQIDGFGAIELQIYCNLMNSFDLLIDLITLMLVISKFDIILVSVCIRSFVSIFTVRYLLKNKKFC